MLILTQKTHSDNIIGRNEIVAALQFSTQLLKKDNHELWWDLNNPLEIYQYRQIFKHRTSH